MQTLLMATAAIKQDRHGGNTIMHACMHVPEMTFRTGTVAWTKVANWSQHAELQGTRQLGHRSSCFI